MPAKKKIEITDIQGNVQEVTTAEIETITPYCPYIFPDKRCGHVGSKVTLKEGRIITAESVKELKARVSEVKGRVRGKNKPEEAEG